MSEEHAIEQQREVEPRVTEAAQKFLADMEEERIMLQDAFPICSLLIAEAVERIYATGCIPGREYYADVFKQRAMKVSQKVFVPVKQYPKFNFTGKILGPKGNSLRRLQEETQCRIAIKGRNSMRDAAKEEIKRNSSDARYNHLNKDLYVEISTMAPPAESYARVAYALNEIRKYLVPDKNDEVSHEQMLELMEIDPKAVKHFNGPAKIAKKSVFNRKFSSAGSLPKYMSLIKGSHEPEEEHEEEEEKEEAAEYEAPKAKRHLVPAYGKAKPKFTPTPPVKRPAPTGYTSEIKRSRDCPVEAILKKIK